LKTTYIVLMEVQHLAGKPPIDERIEAALEHSTAAEALSEALGATVLLRPARRGLEIARKKS